MSSSLKQDGPGLGYTSHRISESLRLRVQLKILWGLTNADIVQQNKDEFLDAYMSQQHGSITDRILAGAQLAKSKPPKDYFLSSTDVANIRKGLDKRDWLFSDNPQESVLMWATQNEADVLYVDEQQPLKGTPDYAFLAGTTQKTSNIASATEQTICSQPAASQPGGSQFAGFPTAAPQPGSTQSSGSQPGASQQRLAASGSLSNQTAEDDCVPTDAALGPAFDGADDDLSKPECISLQRDQQPHLISQEGKGSKGKASKFNADNWTHFSIAIMQDCNVEAAMRWGHNRPLQLDSTHACNAQKFPLFTLVAVDDNGKAVPIAFLITSQELADLIQKFLEAITAKVSIMIALHCAL